MPQILARKAKTLGGRNGTIKAEKSELSLTMQKPKEMGGEDNKQTNPEELFSMGYSSCFASSIEYLLNDQSIDYEDIEVAVSTKLVTDSDEGFEFEIDVYPKIKGLDAETEEKIIDLAYDFCPYSKAIKNSVNVKIHKK